MEILKTILPVLLLLFGLWSLIWNTSTATDNNLGIVFAIFCGVIGAASTFVSEASVWRTIFFFLSRISLILLGMSVGASSNSTSQGVAVISWINNAILSGLLGLLLFIGLNYSSEKSTEPWFEQIRHVLGSLSGHGQPILGCIVVLCGITGFALDIAIIAISSNPSFKFVMVYIFSLFAYVLVFVAVAIYGIIWFTDSNSRFLDQVASGVSGVGIWMLSYTSGFWGRRAAFSLIDSTTTASLVFDNIIIWAVFVHALLGHLHNTSSSAYETIADRPSVQPQPQP